MIPQLESAEYVGGHVIHVRFADGIEADLDLKAELWREVFEPLKDPEVFRQFHLDLAPEFLYQQAAQQAAAVNGAARPYRASSHNRLDTCHVTHYS